MLSATLKSVDILQKVWCREGSVPVHTQRSDISYGTFDAKASYGIFRLKVWIFERDVFASDKVVVAETVLSEDYKRRILFREDGKPNARPSINREGQAKAPKHRH